VVPPNVPNVLTMLRILLVPVLLVALLDKTPSLTLLRMGATQHGVVAAANPLGKLKTVQVATIIALIASSARPTWLDLMVYATVLVTVVSGVDFVFGLRRRLSEAEVARASRNSAAESGA
jgi:CDP-diacylglycerol---glycerol-3-phosphate 3-phosphatidyltransferase